MGSMDFKSKINQLKRNRVEENPFPNFKEALNKNTDLAQGHKHRVVTEEDRCRDCEELKDGCTCKNKTL